MKGEGMRDRGMVMKVAKLQTTGQTITNLLVSVGYNFFFQPSSLYKKSKLKLKLFQFFLKRLFHRINLNSSKGAASEAVHRPQIHLGNLALVYLFLSEEKCCLVQRVSAK